MARSRPERSLVPRRDFIKMITALGLNLALPSAISRILAYNAPSILRPTEAQGGEDIEKQMRLVPELTNAVFTQRDLGVDGYKITYFLAINSEGKLLGIYVPDEQAADGVPCWRTKETKIAPIGKWMTDKTVVVNLANMPWEQVEALTVKKDRFPSFMDGKGREIKFNAPKWEENNAEGRNSKDGTKHVGLTVLPGTAAPDFLDGTYREVLGKNAHSVTAVTPDKEVVVVDTAQKQPTIIVEVVDVEKMDVYLGTYGLSRLKKSPAYYQNGLGLNLLRVYNPETNVLTIYDFVSPNIPASSGDLLRLQSDVFWGISGSAKSFEDYFKNILAESIPWQLNTVPANKNLRIATCIVSDADLRTLQDYFGTKDFNTK